MKIRLLGAHSFESRSTRLTAILIDDSLALDAGGLTSGLSFAEQEKIEFILLTHAHYDHVRDVPAIALRSAHRSIAVYATRPTLEVLSSHLMDGLIYPRFSEWPSAESPVLRLHSLDPYQSRVIGGYRVLPVPVNHAIPAVGYEVTDAAGASVFFTGDAGPGLARCWDYVSPNLLIVETHFSNRSAAIAPGPGHLCPSLLQEELLSLRSVKGHVPKVVLTHLNPEVEDEIRKEAEQVARNLGADITLAFEGMEIEL